MAEMNLQVAVRETEQDVVIQMGMDGAPLGHMFLDASGLDGLIEQLAECRMRLQDQVALELDPGFRLKAIYDPAWKTETFKDDPSHAVLILRHPGLGWVSFVLPPNEVAELGSWLAAHRAAGEGASPGSSSSS